VDRLNLTGIDRAYRPRLKLFLSADIIGSTAYKQPLDIVRDDPNEHAKWSEIIQGFYKTVREAFEEHWENADNSLRLPGRGGSEAARKLLGERPRFWKTIGDEVVFWKDLTDARQIWLTLACWLKTIESLRNYFRDKPDESANNLDVKSAAWIAGFPVRNKAVLDVASAHMPLELIVGGLNAFYDAEEGAPVADFIGPGIDVGFRISGLASSRKLAISLDVAYILAKSHEAMEAEVAKRSLLTDDYFPEGDGSDDEKIVGRLKVHYSGSEPLKGVLGGIHYPKFWISAVRHDSLEHAKVHLYSKHDGQQVDFDHLKRFCEKFYSDRRKYVSKPFIDGDALIGEFPRRYESFLRASVPREMDKPELSFDI
jgi:hypothetical protein